MQPDTKKKIVDAIDILVFYIMFSILWTFIVLIVYIIANYGGS